LHVFTRDGPPGRTSSPRRPEKPRKVIIPTIKLTRGFDLANNANNGARIALLLLIIAMQLPKSVLIRAAFEFLAFT
jgi:hypothetical protein